MVCEHCNGSRRAVYYEEIGRDEYTVTMERKVGVCPTCNGTGVKPQTNADRIRAMSDEELADVVANGVGCVLKAPHCMDDDCTPCILRWLKQPVEEAK